jgi:hypothetical protein
MIQMFSLRLCTYGPFPAVASSIFYSRFVLDKPMIISKFQMEELKQLLFLNVDQNCKRTSVHHEQSVARPIQPTGTREVRRCTRANYKDDLDRE